MSGLQTLDFEESLSMEKAAASRSDEETGLRPGFGLGGRTHFLLVVILMGSLISSGRSLTGGKADVGMWVAAVCFLSSVVDEGACFLSSCVVGSAAAGGSGMAISGVLRKKKRGKAEVSIS